MQTRRKRNENGYEFFMLTLETSQQRFLEAGEREREKDFKMGRRNVNQILAGGKGQDYQCQISEPNRTRTFFRFGASLWMGEGDFLENCLFLLGVLKMYWFIAPSVPSKLLM